MGIVVSFSGYTPAARFDSVAWASAKVYEAPTSVGDWTLIDTLPLSPTDVDPSDPASRNLTTDEGTAVDLWYRLVFVDANGDSSEPTTPVQNSESPSGTIYATRDELKTSLSAQNTTYLDDDLDDALQAASRAIDEATGRRFYPTTETRVYTADYPNIGRWRSPSPILRILEIDDLNSLDTLTVDTDGNGVYETTWTEGTDFVLDPPNHPLVGYPYERVVIPRHSGRVFPAWDNAVEIVGSFGFATAPPEVKQYTKIFAAQLMLRSRQAPFGILMAGVEIGAMTRLSRFDPDFDRLLGHLVKPHQLIA